MSDDEAEHEERASKSARKRASEELQELGEALIELPDAVFNALPLPDNLRDAVLAARRYPSHGAQLRQRQYIGKLMRKVDAEPIRAAIEAQRQQQHAAARQFQRIELWRDRLLNDVGSALEEFLVQNPHADADRLSALIAAATAESRQQTAPRAARQLFQYLRELLT